MILLISLYLITDCSFLIIVDYFSVVFIERSVHNAFKHCLTGKNFQCFGFKNSSSGM